MLPTIASGSEAYRTFVEYLLLVELRLETGTPSGVTMFIVLGLFALHRSSDGRTYS
jgi:hypothetical protein